MTVAPLSERKELLGQASSVCRLTGVNQHGGAVAANLLPRPVKARGRVGATGEFRLRIHRDATPQPELRSSNASSALGTVFTPKPAQRRWELSRTWRLPRVVWFFALERLGGLASGASSSPLDQRVTIGQLRGTRRIVHRSECLSPIQAMATRLSGSIPGLVRCRYHRRHGKCRRPARVTGAAC